MKFTIFTPTYNRAHTLVRLYNSLESQTLKDFEWLVIDDGSEDDTRKYIKELQSESSFKIRYVYQKNSGKQAAYNVGIANTESELFMCIDSDDQLKNNSLEELERAWSLLNSHEKKNCAGIIFLGCDIKGNVIGTELPQIKFSTMYDLYHKFSVKGDKGLLFQTEILKKYNFPTQSGEKFITEAVLYNRIGKNHKFYCLNKALEIVDYQKDGLSSRYQQLMLENPIGSSIYFNELNFYEKKFKQRVKNDAVHTKFKLLGRASILDIYRSSLNKKHFILGFGLGGLMYAKTKVRVFLKGFSTGEANDT